jgi:ubiquinone/menaquinone biosynthesis C-methylase UbiE
MYFGSDHCASWLPRSAGTSRDDIAVLAHEDAYSLPPVEGARYGEWRRTSGAGKADRVVHALRSLPAEEVSLLDVGCGDGALLVALATRRPGWTTTGIEVSRAAAAIAARRLPDVRIETYDGDRLPWPDGSFDAGVLSHVLEHDADPVALLAEVARVCRVVVVEVPLERNVSARRAGKRVHAEEIGHIQRFSRADVRRIVAAAGLELREEASATVAREVLRFFADGPRGRIAADMKWLVQRTLHGTAPALARRLFTVQYVAVCSR